MSPKTDPPPSAKPEASLDSPAVASPGSSAQSSLPRRKPHLSLFIATAGGLGYLPKAPGTWGSLAGVVVYILFAPRYGRYIHVFGLSTLLWNSAFLAVIAVLIAFLGVWSAHRVVRFAENKDPQFVVIDEVFGQFLACLVALAPVNWKYLGLGFILFRLFDIWKPFPARQAESLPGGWGVMADDWIAGIYAGLGLWLARALGL